MASSRHARRASFARVAWSTSISVKGKRFTWLAPMRAEGAIAVAERERPARLDVTALGQVFTPPAVVAQMLALRRNQGRTLEPSCGDGAFSRQLAACVAIEFDARV